MSSNDSPADLADLREQMAELLASPKSDTPEGHARRMLIAAALCSEALRRRGMTAALVGGSALEAYAPGAYTTEDIDMVVAKGALPAKRAELDAVFTGLGLARVGGRHWSAADIFIDVPSSDLPVLTEQRQVGPYVVQLIAKELPLVGRLVEYEQTGHTGHAAQAVVLLRALREEVNYSLLERLVREERVEGAYAAVLRFADQAPAVQISDAALRDARDEWRGIPPVDPDVETLAPRARGPNARDPIHPPRTPQPPRQRRQP